MQRRCSHHSRGVTLIELVTALGIIGVATAIMTPNLVRAMRTYRLNGAAEQVAGALQTAKFTAVRANTTQSVFFNPTTNAVAVGQTTAAAAVPLPAGVTLATTTVTAPAIITTAVANAGAIAGQQADSHIAVSFPAVTGQTNFKQAGFTSRGLPNVTPGAVNWIYVTNAQGDLMAVTITSAGSTRIWRWNATTAQWS
jgi:prepilin-type N-terminal cleavage/methylation domain-containing protein